MAVLELMGDTQIQRRPEHASISMEGVGQLQAEAAAHGIASVHTTRLSKPVNVAAEIVATLAFVRSTVLLPSPPSNEPCEKSAPSAIST